MTMIIAVIWRTVFLVLIDRLNRVTWWWRFCIKNPHSNEFQNLSQCFQIKASFLLHEMQTLVSSSKV